MVNADVEIMKKICNKYGCKALIDIRDKYCNEHRQHDLDKVRQWRREYDKRRVNDKYHKFYRSNQWSIVRDYVLKRDNYLCQHCLDSGKLTISSTVHHIIPIRVDYDMALDTDNLITICHDCHNKIHNRF